MTGLSLYGEAAWLSSSLPHYGRPAQQM